MDNYYELNSIILAITCGGGRGYEGRILLFGNAHVEANVRLSHDVTRSWIQQDRFLVEFRHFSRSDAHQCHSVPNSIKRKIINHDFFIK